MIHFKNDRERFAYWKGYYIRLGALKFFQTFWHGSRTDEPFSEFNTTHGAYFDASRAGAKAYAGIGKDFGCRRHRLYRVYLMVHRPEVFNMEVDVEFERFTSLRIPSRDLQDEGYDGQVLLNCGKIDQVRICHPFQVKSARWRTYYRDGSPVADYRRFQQSSGNINF